MKNKFYNKIGECRGINKLVDVIDDEKGIFECLVCSKQKELSLMYWLYSNTKKCTCEFKNTAHKLYSRYSKMINRCYNKKAHNYSYYGGRGITVCDRWLESFDNFLEDMEESFKEGLELDRINNNGSYSPDNCKWVTHSKNMQNRKEFKNKNGYTNIHKTFGGKFEGRLQRNNVYYSTGLYNTAKEAYEELEKIKQSL